MTAMRPYDFDPVKEIENIRKHRLSFDDGYRVLDQIEPMLMTWLDQRQDYGEDRWNTLGPLPQRPDQILHVCWAEAHDRIRIISVRIATNQERNRHASRHRRPR